MLFVDLDDFKLVNDSLGYGEPIPAPADGIVAETRDGVPDALRASTGWAGPFAPDLRGNFVVVRHADSEFSLVAHLAPGSVRVREGERVRRGQQVGRCGNSGNSTEPHLHFQVQDRQDFFGAAGLPMAFDGVSVHGGIPPTHDTRNATRGSGRRPPSANPPARRPRRKARAPHRENGDSSSPSDRFSVEEPRAGRSAQSARR